MKQRVIVLVGSPAVGKTTVATGMLERLADDWDYITEEDGLRPMCAKIAALDGPAVVELMRMTPAHRAVLAGHDTTIVQVWCTERERSRRLTALGRPYEKAINPQQKHMKLDTTNLDGHDLDNIVRMAGKAKAMSLAAGMRK